MFDYQTKTPRRMDYAELGRRIRIARVEASLSQDAVAQYLELPRSAVSLIESGKRKVDSLELERFSCLVGKNVLFFFDEEPEPIEASDFDHKEIAAKLLAHIGCSTLGIKNLKKFPDKYKEIVFEAYSKGFISLSKLAELLECSLEEAKYQLKARKISINLGVNSELDLLSDIENA